MRPKVAVITEIPTPYRDPVFALAKDDPTFDFSMFYLAMSQNDRAWGNDRFARFDAIDLKSSQMGIGRSHTVYFTTDVKQKVIAQNFDAFVLCGYAQPAMIQLLRHCWAKQIPYIMMTESHHRKKRSSFLRWMKTSYLRKVYSRSKANLVTSSAAKEYVQSYGAPDKNIFILPNTIDGPEYGRAVQSLKKEAQKLKSDWGWKDRQIILFVGALTKIKGADLLVEAFSKIAFTLPQSTLLIAGQGALRDELIRRIQVRGLQERVRFLGFVNPQDLRRFYAVSDLLVVPSRQDTFGAVVCEAAAAGLPIIASSAAGASADFVQNDVNGRVVESENVAEFENALRDLLTQPSLLKTMGEASKRIMEQWTHTRLANHFVQAVKSALNL